MFSKEVLKSFQCSKNLLAFSAGVDSTALFFLLLEEGVEFDIAIVDYGLREQSKDEVAYAKELATKHNKQIFTIKAPKFTNNFEANAREFRYSFFKEIVEQNGYSNLITAHQLNDKLEWFLMRLSKGAGVVTLSGMQEIEDRGEYNLIRPLLDTTKDELINYLEKNSIKYFVDKSNFLPKYERNRFRPIVDSLLKEQGRDGFVRSFKILNQEANIVKSGFKLLSKSKKFRVVELNSIEFLPYAINHHLKELGYQISTHELELIKEQKSLVAGRVWAIEIVDNLLYIAPYVKVVLPKEFKESCRIKKIPPKVRGYLFSEGVELL